MMQQQNLDVQKQEQQKSKIQEQERRSSTILGIAIICYIIIYIYNYVDNLLDTTHNFIALRAIFSLIWITINTFVIICSIIWTRAIKRQKKEWMNDYGQLITATVIRGTWYLIVIEWRDPETKKAYRYEIPGSRFQNPMPIWIDPNDPKFCYANRGHPRLIET